MPTIDLKGIIPATVLPMTQDAEIDEPALRKYIRWIAGQGVGADDRGRQERRDRVRH